MAERTVADMALSLTAGLRVEVAWGNTFARALAGVAPADREALVRIITAARQAREEALAERVARDAEGRR